ncbi:hypothetical protein [Aquincola sp. J276]|uniref:hypothetical protein n=1 Tax=Aquincola sp. J276 TaxID=2898432 RepID=UPI00215131DE|nr:hypothetical protein [Aquincola sp. J276]MCR5864045.1 hypothetical protein [Aquincola sp. J276]
MTLHPWICLAAGLLAGSAHAFSCAPTGSSPCEIEFSTATVVFDQGTLNFSSETQFNGTDGSVNGYAPGDFPELTPVDTDGGTRVGFSFTPNMSAQVGGSGFQGFHEATASFTFERLVFAPKAGYQLVGVEFTVTGARGQVGNGQAPIAVPGIPVQNGDTFVASDVWHPFQTTFSASLGANAFYQEGPDGTAAEYGTAFARFDSVRIVAHLAPVPEVGTGALSLLGLLALGSLRVHRRVSGSTAGVEDAAPMPPIK